MNVTARNEGKTLILELDGRLDTTTASILDTSIKQNLGDNEELILDFAKLEYISSAGLRILLATQKIFNSKGKMIVKNVNESIMEVFEITGFVDILTIE